MLEFIPAMSTDRIESLKAGTIAALSTTIAYGLIQITYGLVSIIIPNLVITPSLTLSNITSLTPILIIVAPITLSGAMFGITYRYAIRQDANMHLRAGVVTAFGLVRGLAHLDETILMDALQPLQLITLAILPIMESLILFAAARLVLDGAIHYHRLQTLP